MFTERPLMGEWFLLYKLSKILVFTVFCDQSGRVLSCSIHHYIENVIINKMLTIVSNYICVPHSVNWSRQFDHRFSTSLCVCVFLMCDDYPRFWICWEVFVWYCLIITSLFVIDHQKYGVSTVPSSFFGLPHIWTKTCSPHMSIFYDIFHIFHRFL